MQTAREFAPDFKPSLLERFERIRIRDRFRNVMADDRAGAQSENPLSPNKAAARTQNVNNQQMHQKEQPQAVSSLAVASQNTATNQTSIRRASVNSMMQRQQKSMDYSHMNSTMNQSDISNTLGQQFGQPQPPGLSPMSTPQKFSQSSQNNHIQNTSQYSQQQHNAEEMNASYQTYSTTDYQQNMSAYGGGNSRRNSSRLVSDSGRPMLGSINQQASIDHFDHYKRPPSRDSSVDRYSRAASRLGGGSRQPSIDRQAPIVNATDVPSVDRNVRAGSQMRGMTPAPQVNGAVLTGIGSRQGSRAGTPVFQPTKQQLASQIQAQYSTPNQPFEDILLRQRTLGQDIIPSPAQPKRTESLFVPTKPGDGVASGGGGGGGGGASKGSKVRVA